MSHNLFRTLLTLLVAALCFAQAGAQPPQPEVDSLRVCRILTESKALPPGRACLMYIAESFLGTPYQAHTLDTGTEEMLTLRTDSLDCTTYVELVTALALTAAEGSTRYDRVRQRLTQLRYRDGTIHGYLSRLHYFSHWIAHNEQQGFVKEVTSRSPHASSRLQLTFMSSHPSAYPQLRHDSLMAHRLRDIERKRPPLTVNYIPKGKLGTVPDSLYIHDGDIIALTTRVAGLDISHVGFAKYVDGELHLLNASSIEGKVVVDDEPLWRTLAQRKSITGIRVISVCLSPSAL